MSLTITWLGHASFKIANSSVVYIDPWKIGSAPADGQLVLVSHSHYDHYSEPDVSAVLAENGQVVASSDVIEQFGRGQTIVPGQQLQFSNVLVTGVAAYNPNKQFHPQSNDWLGFVIEMDGVRIYYAGDTDLIPEMESLQGVDVVLLPVGGTYTMDAEEAARACNMMQPKYAVPYHFGDIVGSTDDAARFARAAACPAIVLEPGQSWTVGKDRKQ